MSQYPDRPESPDPENMLTTIASPSPQFPEKELRYLLREQYGLEGELQELVSERDQNMRIATAAGEKYVLKIANTTEDPVVTDFQIKALLHLRGSAHGVNVPKVIQTLDGSASTKISGAHAEHIVRLVSYLPGVPFADVTPAEELARSLGESLAKLGLALRSFGHPGDQQVLLWDLQRASQLRGVIRHVAEVDLRAAISRCLDEFENSVRPRLNILRTQVIHSDLNPGNALVDPDDHSRIAGVIDFGDMVRAPLIIDVAIAASYLRSDDDELLSLVAPFVAAYDRITPLENTELELLYELIRTRLITTITLLRWRLSDRGKDDVYSQEAMRSEQSAERFFLALSLVPAKRFTEQIRRACGR
jgi:hydroxylysine kinase